MQSFLTLHTNTDFIPGEEYFQGFLQRPIVFTSGEKTLRKGKLLLFRQSHFYIQFVLERLTATKTIDTFELPIPFNIDWTEEKTGVLLDYRIVSLLSKSERENILTTLNRTTDPLDKIIELKIFNKTI